MATFLAPGPEIYAHLVLRSDITIGGSLFGVAEKAVFGYIGLPASERSVEGSIAEANTSLCSIRARIEPTLWPDLCLGGLVSQVRSRMNDYPAVNRLLDGVEVSDKAIYSALKIALDSINDYPPYTLRWACSVFPAKTLLINGAVVFLLKTLIHTDVRNTVQYNAAGLSTTEFGKSPAYMQMLSMYQQRWDMAVQGFKTQANLDQAWGGLTGYGISNFDGFWNIGY